MPKSSQSNPVFSNRRTIFFVIIICFVCAFILSLLAAVLKEPQELAKELYRSKQLLQSAKILNHSSEFIILDPNNKISPAVYDSKKQILIKTEKPVAASSSDILAVYEKRIVPRLVTSDGLLKTFQELNINENEYINAYDQEHSSSSDYRLIFLITPNLPSFDEKKNDLEGYVIPISGFGLWDAINGYLAIRSDADTVIGCTWYNQKETPGLGGEISTPEWQKQFLGKKIFQEGSSGSTNFARAPLGIKVVKTTVEQTYGTSPKGLSAVDGISGATITATGVSEAFRTSLSFYRPFLINAHSTFLKKANATE